MEKWERWDVDGALNNLGRELLINLYFSDVETGIIEEEG